VGFGCGEEREEVFNEKKKELEFYLLLSMPFIPKPGILCDS